MKILIFGLTPDTMITNLRKPHILAAEGGVFKKCRVEKNTSLAKKSQDLFGNKQTKSFIHSFNCSPQYLQ